MGKTFIISLAFLLALTGSASAQQAADGDAALLESLGLERAVDLLTYTHTVSGYPVRMTLNAEQAARIAVFLEQLHASPSTTEAVLSRIALDRLRQARLSADAAAPDGTFWFTASISGRYELTKAGRRAIPGIVVGSGSVENARAMGALVPPARLGGVSDRVERVLSAAKGVNFDGSPAVVNGPASESVCTVAPQAASTRLSPTVPPPHTEFEKDAFWSTWGAYQATWGADFATTAMILGHHNGGESDPLYTAFGKQSKAGVLGSVAVVHVVASVASLVLYDQAQKTHGFWRVVMDLAGVGINAGFTGAHTEGSIHNVQLLQHWKD